MDEREIASLQKILLFAKARTSKGDTGTISEVKKGSVKFRPRGHVDGTLYPTYDSFADGTLALEDRLLQAKTMEVLDGYARRAQIPSRKKLSASALRSMAESERHPQDTEAENSDRGIVASPMEIDVSKNLAVICLLFGVPLTDCTTHLHSLGMEGFDVSPKAGFRGRHAFAALRECGNYLKCGVERLCAVAHRFSYAPSRAMRRGGPRPAAASPARHIA